MTNVETGMVQRSGWLVWLGREGEEEDRAKTAFFRIFFYPLLSRQGTGFGSKAFKERNGKGWAGKAGRQTGKSDGAFPCLCNITSSSAANKSRQSFNRK